MSAFWHGWILGTALACGIGTVVCLVMLIATGSFVFAIAFLICYAGAKVALHLEQKARLVNAWLRGAAMNAGDFTVMVRYERAWWVRPFVKCSAVALRVMKWIHLPGRTLIANWMLAIALDGVRTSVDDLT